MAIKVRTIGGFETASSGTGCCGKRPGLSGQRSGLRGHRSGLGDPIMMLEGVGFSLQEEVVTVDLAPTSLTTTRTFGGSLIDPSTAPGGEPPPEEPLPDYSSFFTSPKYLVATFTPTTSPEPAPSGSSLAPTGGTAPPYVPGPSPTPSPTGFPAPPSPPPVGVDPEAGKKVKVAIAAGGAMIAVALLLRGR